MKEATGMPKLSESEWIIMKAFWKKGAMALGDLVGELGGEQDWAYYTVKTLATRLVSKGWLTAKRVGGSYLYSPAVERSKAVRQALKDFTGRVLDGMLSPVIAHMFEEKSVSESDVKQLEQLLKTYKKSKGRKQL
jgi:BlaI family penicillinase repressor